MSGIVGKLDHAYDPEERRRLGTQGGLRSAKRAKVAKAILQELSESKGRTGGGLRSLYKDVKWRGQKIRVCFIEQSGAAHCKNKDKAVELDEPVKLAWGFVKSDYVIKLTPRMFGFLQGAYKHWKTKEVS